MSTVCVCRYVSNVRNRFAVASIFLFNFSNNCAIFEMVIILKIGSGYFTHIAHSVPKLGFVHYRFINNPAPECQILIS